MKLKGVNPIEQHIEKIVLMVMLVLLLAVLAMQFVSRPNDIDVGDRSVSPDQVYTVLEGEASRLDGQLKNQNPSLPEINEVDLVQRYNDAFANASGGRVELTAALSIRNMFQAFNHLIFHPFQSKQLSAAPISSQYS